MRLFALLEPRNRVLMAMVVAASLVPFLNLIPGIAAVNGAPQLTFPWGSSVNPDNANPSGKFTGGPHGFNPGDDSHTKPWNSLDYGPVDNRVYAARGGNAYVDCYSEQIKVIHGDGYVTTYTHLEPTSIRIINGQYVTRGTWLANTIQHAPTCGTGQNHVHFALWYAPGTTFNYLDSQAVDWGGQNGSSVPTAVAGQPQIGAWVADDGGIPGQQYAGCMTPLATPGVRYCPNAQADPCPSCTYIFNDSINEQIPVARRPQGGTEDLFMRGTTLHAYHTPTDSSGTPTAWEDHLGLIKGSPTGVWDASTSRLDMYVVGSDSRIYRQVFTATGGWGAWEVMSTSPGLGFSGPSLTETVTVDRPSGGGFDLLIRGPSGDAQDASLDGGGNLQFWESLGSPLGAGINGTPSSRWNLQGTRQDVFAVGSDDHVYIKSWTGSAWTSWRGPYPGPAVASAVASSSGARASVNEQVMAVRAPDDTIDLFYRGQSNDAVHVRVDRFGNFLGWDSLGGVVKGAPDGMWDATMTRLDVFVIGTDDRGYQNTNTMGIWSGWRVLPGGGVSG